MTEPKWRKASFSDSNGACVELAEIGDGVAMRDSKDPDGPMLHLTRNELAAWVQGCKSGEFDDLVG